MAIYENMIYETKLINTILDYHIDISINKRKLLCEEDKYAPLDTHHFNYAIKYLLEHRYDLAKIFHDSNSDEKQIIIEQIKEINKNIKEMVVL